MARTSRRPKDRTPKRNDIIPGVDRGAVSPDIAFCVGDLNDFTIETLSGEIPNNRIIASYNRILSPSRFSDDHEARRLVDNGENGAGTLVSSGVNQFTIGSNFFPRFGDTLTEFINTSDRITAYNRERTVTFSSLISSFNTTTKVVTTVDDMSNDIREGLSTVGNTVIITKYSGALTADGDFTVTGTLRADLIVADIEAGDSRLPDITTVGNIPVFTTEVGNIGQLTTAQLVGNLGLDNVDNTSDLDKPISTATQTELDLKANIASPTFTGQVSVPSTQSSDSGTTAVSKDYVDAGDARDDSFIEERAVTETIGLGNGSLGDTTLVSTSGEPILGATFSIDGTEYTITGVVQDIQFDVTISPSLVANFAGGDVTQTYNVVTLPTAELNVSTTNRRQGAQSILLTNELIASGDTADLKISPGLTYTASSSILSTPGIEVLDTLLVSGGATFSSTTEGVRFTGLRNEPTGEVLPLGITRDGTLSLEVEQVLDSINEVRTPGGTNMFEIASLVNSGATSLTLTSGTAVVGGTFMNAGGEIFTFTTGGSGTVSFTPATAIGIGTFSNPFTQTLPPSIDLTVTADTITFGVAENPRGGTFMHQVTSGNTDRLVINTGDTGQVVFSNLPTTLDWAQGQRGTATSLDGAVSYTFIVDGFTVGVLTVTIETVLFSDGNSKGQWIVDIIDATPVIVGTSTFNNIRIGTLANPPAGMVAGETWLDTTTSADHPIQRVSLNAT